jgi:hypothetical protein
MLFVFGIQKLVQMLIDIAVCCFDPLLLHAHLLKAEFDKEVEAVVVRSKYIAVELVQQKGVEAVIYKALQRHGRISFAPVALVGD